MESRLFEILQKLKKEEFEIFKWFLTHDNILHDHKGIPKSKLEKANRHDTVDTMINKYDSDGALQVTRRILQKMEMNALERELSSQPNTTVEEGQLSRTVLNTVFDLIGNVWLWRHSAPPAEDQTHKQVIVQNFVRQRVKHTPKLKTQDSTVPKEGSENKMAALRRLQQHAVDVTLDRNTAHPHLVLSDDGKQVYDGDTRQQVPYDRRRFTTCVCVLGEQGFSSGSFYFEVQVKGKIAWTLGVAAESIDRRGDIKVAPDDGFWTIRLRNYDEYAAANNSLLRLAVERELLTVGVFVDCDGGEVSFYNADTADLLYSFTRCRFTDKLFPYISPCCNYGGINSAPLVICPVKSMH